MRLTAFTGGKKRGSGVGGAKVDQRTTVPGYVNGNRQEVMARTGFKSASFPGQVIYKMRCGVCRGEYGANGCDIHARLCPLCQQGKAGEVLREAALGLFG
jgi:hypothetical protein